MDDVAGPAGARGHGGGARGPRATAVGGPQLVVALLVLTLLSIGLPLAGAKRINGARLLRALRDAEAIAGTLRQRDRVSLALLGGAAIVAGPGEMPAPRAGGAIWPVPPVSCLDDDTVSKGHEWRAEACRALKTAGPDPWNNRYLLAVLPDDDGVTFAVLVLSAGPNGVLESEIPQAGEGGRAAGDDVMLVAP